MGEIAEMMLDGTMCEGCGEFLDDDEAGGYPRRCAGCLSDFEIPPKPAPRPKPHVCPQCGKRFHVEQSVRDHVRVKHPTNG